MRRVITYTQHLLDLGLPTRILRYDLLPSRVNHPLVRIRCAFSNFLSHESDEVDELPVRDGIRDDVLEKGSVR